MAELISSLNNNLLKMLHLSQFQAFKDVTALVCRIWRDWTPACLEKIHPHPHLYSHRSWSLKENEPARSRKVHLQHVRYQRLATLTVSALPVPLRPVRAHVCLCSIRPSVWDSAADTSDCSLAQTPSCRKTDNWLFCGDPQRWQQPLLLVSLAIKLVSRYQLCDLKPHSEAESILWCWETA